ncbi:putative paraoxonase [Lophium mytilinum]|uniref:Putative paraoxonase n=1 Tax=Lophium mytilinum TaxID=390894 RepID=A0A6A6RDP5_9PEZI|nr:putative paraoxonase [Lophium mytilinum]
MITNAPHKITPLSTFKSQESRLTHSIRNCEDGLMDEAMGLAILSCDAGRDSWNTVLGYFNIEAGVSGGLYLYDYSNTDLSDDEALKRITFSNFPSSETDFHPLGIEYYAPTSTLYVVNHARSGSAVEIFQLSISDAIATHVGTLKHPLLPTPNAIVAINEAEIFVSNDHHFRVRFNPVLAKMETYVGIPGGSVVHINLAKNITRTVARVPMANGIKFLNETTLAVSSSSTESVRLYNVTESRDLAFLKSITVPEGSPDNLSVDGNGKLLIAAHMHVPSMMKVAISRIWCNSPEGQGTDVCKVRAPSWLGEWSEEGGMKTLYRGVDIMTASTVMRDTTRGIGLVTGLYDRGVMVFQD